MKIGFIGAGNMSTAIISGYVVKNKHAAKQIFVSDVDTNKAQAVAKKLGVNSCITNQEVVKNSEIIILAVKPNVYLDVLNEIKNLLSNQHIIVSIAAGVSIKKIEQQFTRKIKIVRTMPNTPAMVNEGMTVVAKNDHVSQPELEHVLQLFNSVGKTAVIDEKLMDVIPGVSGSSPAYVCMLIEALADGAVLHGMPRDQAYQFAAQAVMGAAKMVLESGQHPGQLKDMICSPGETTIEAVKSLEKNGFRSAIIEAVDACTKKAKIMNND